MVFGLFKKKDPICGMKETKGKGMYQEGNWFCSKSCLDQFNKAKKEAKKADKPKVSMPGGKCCH